MQITKKDLKQLIQEEVDRVESEVNEFDMLLESYAKDYDSDEETVSKQALIDFLEVLEESRIPLDAFMMFMENMPEESVSGILSEVVDLEEMHGQPTGGDPDVVPSDPKGLKNLILRSVMNPAERQTFQQLIAKAGDDVRQLRDIYNQMTKTYPR